MVYDLTAIENLLFFSVQSLLASIANSAGDSLTLPKPPSVVTEVFDLAGDHRPVAKEQLSGDYSARIYSWSEIENLGRQPDLQRTLLDRPVERLPEYCEKRTASYAQLAENRRLVQNVCQKLGAKLDEERGILRNFSQFKYDFERINTPEVATLFEQLDVSRERLGILTSFRDVLLNLRTKIQSVSSVSIPASIEDVLSDKPEAIRAWWETEISARLRLIEIADATAVLAGRVDSRIEEKLQSIEALRASENSKIAYDEAALRERTQASPQEELVREKREQSERRFDAASSAPTTAKRRSPLRPAERPDGRPLLRDLTAKWGLPSAI